MEKLWVKAEEKAVAAEQVVVWEMEWDVGPRVAAGAEIEAEASVQGDSVFVPGAVPRCLIKEVRNARI